jgi:hypothetical protein
MNTFDKLRLLYKVGFQTGQPKIFSFHDCLPDVFSGYIELLVAKRYRILGAQELMERLVVNRGPAGSGKQKEVVLTFDDGRRNCWTVIFPMLKKYRIKALFFVIPSRVEESDEYFPNLEDYWQGKVSWENLFSSHRRQPYLTWKELAVMQESGLVDVFSHSLRHEVVPTSSRIIDFQHPGVYEMPVYFDEWFLAGASPCDTLWGAPVYERAWAPLTANVYCPNRKIDVLMNDFVRKCGGHLFFKNKEWRRRLFDHYQANRRSFLPGHFKRIQTKEEARFSIFESKKIIESRMKNQCVFFSLPLYQGAAEMIPMLEEAGYKGVFAGPTGTGIKSAPRFSQARNLFFLNRIPSFWMKFLSLF